MDWDFILLIAGLTIGSLILTLVGIRYFPEWIGVSKKPKPDAKPDDRPQ